MSARPRNMKRRLRGLDVHVTNTCNHRCPWCVQAIPLGGDLEEMSLARLEELSELFRDTAIDEVHVSGGEPTLHPEFSAISASLSRLLPSRRGNVLLTNGCALERHLDDLRHYEYAEVSHYAGLNDELIARLEALHHPRVRVKHTAGRLQDYRGSTGQDPTRWRRCPLAGWAKLTRDRVYRCCTSRGVGLYHGIDRDLLSAPAAPGWREALDRVDLSVACGRCPG